MPDLPKYIQVEVTRHGKKVYYFRRGARRFRMPDPELPAFAQAYENALANQRNRPPPPEVLQPPNAQRVEAALKRMLSGARQRARKKGLPCTITLDWLCNRARAVGFRCELTGIPFYSIRFGKSRAGNPSVDRIDNSRGYEPDNCRLVLVVVNSMLGDWGEEIFAYVARQAAKRLSQRMANDFSLPTPTRCGIDVSNHLEIKGEFRKWRPRQF